MDEDPDNLAALFFANQAAKEKQKATLPTDDWVKVIDAVLKKRKLRGNTTEGISTDDVLDTHNSSTDDKTSSIDASAWIVTTMPPTPNKQKVNGIDGIMLDTSNTHCSLGVQVLVVSNMN